MPLTGGVPGGAPAGGWPKGALATDVQASLTAADAALAPELIGAPEGVAGLDADSRVPMLNLPFVVLKESEYQALATKELGVLYLRTAG